MVMRCRWSARGLTAPGYHRGARGRDYCVIRNLHKVPRPPPAISGMKNRVQTTMTQLSVIGILIMGLEENIVKFQLPPPAHQGQGVAIFFWQRAGNGPDSAPAFVLAPAFMPPASVFLLQIMATPVSVREANVLGLQIPHASLSRARDCREVGSPGRSDPDNGGDLTRPWVCRASPFWWPVPAAHRGYAAPGV